MAGAANVEAKRPHYRRLRLLRQLQRRQHQLTRTPDTAAQRDVYSILTGFGNFVPESRLHFISLAISRKIGNLFALIEGRDSELVNSATTENWSLTFYYFSHITSK